MMDATMVNEESALGPTIALRSLMATIRRRRRVWLTTALLGLVVGAGLHLVAPQKYSAVTDLYLAQPAGADPAQAMVDDVSLLHTQAVAQQAVSADRLTLSPTALLSHYGGLALSNDILSIKYTAPSQDGAIAGARAVARAFLAVQARELHLQTDVLVRGLQSRISTLNAEISTLNNQITVLSSTPANEQTTSEITQQVSQRSADGTQITQLQSQIQQALLNEQSTDHVSHVLDPAALAPVSVKRVTLVDALSGLVAGLAIGLGVVIFGELLSERVPDRSTVAALLGAPVELSLGRYKHPRVLRRSRLSRSLHNPSPALRMMERRLRGHLESAPESTLAVVAAGAAEPAALAVGALALELSREGHQVVVVDAAEDRPLASILGLTVRPQTMETVQSAAPGGSQVRVIVAPEDPAQMAQKAPPDDADVVVVLATLDPAFGAEHLASWVRDAVMIVCPRGLPITRMSVVPRDAARGGGLPTLGVGVGIRRPGRQLGRPQLRRRSVDTRGIVGTVGVGS